MKEEEMSERDYGPVPELEPIFETSEKQNYENDAIDTDAKVTINNTPADYIIKINVTEKDGKLGRELLRITPTGEVIAPDLESANEAGRVFVESIGFHINKNLNKN